MQIKIGISQDGHSKWFETTFDNLADAAAFISQQRIDDEREKALQTIASLAADSLLSQQERFRRIKNILD